MSGSYQARVAALENEAGYVGRFHVVLAGQTAPERDAIDDGDVIVYLPLPAHVEEEEPVELGVDEDPPTSPRRRYL